MASAETSDVLVVGGGVIGLAAAWRLAQRGLRVTLLERRELVPAVLELELEQVAAGLRPGTPDNIPVVGPGAFEGLGAQPVDP